MKRHNAIALALLLALTGCSPQKPQPLQSKQAASGDWTLPYGEWSFSFVTPKYLPAATTHVRIIDTDGYLYTFNTLDQTSRGPGSVDKWASAVHGALYGGVLMQRLTLFRALLIFGILQGASNAGYWLLSITDKNMISMAAAVFFENLCGGMGTAAFVALLMTLCNKSFSATQFALLSALSAVGRVYVGPIAGWFVEAHGWPTFYLFSVIAAVPGLLLLLVCRQTLEYTQQTEHFMPRTEYHRAYRFALRLLMVGCLALVLWLAVLMINATTSLSLPPESLLLNAGALLVVAGILTGGTLDFLALRKTQVP